MLQTQRTTPAFYQRIRRSDPPPAAVPSMWTRSEVIGIAKASCAFCYGYGLRPLLGGAPAPCACVFRAIFRICHARHRECEALASHTNGIGLERASGPSGYRLYSRKRQEFTADFCLVARRILGAVDYDIFRLHFLGVADWRACCQSLLIDRGTFFHRVYSLMELLGRTYAELRPYPLYPVAGYFAGVVQSPDPGVLPSEADAEDTAAPGLFRWGGRRMISY